MERLVKASWRAALCLCVLGAILGVVAIITNFSGGAGLIFAAFAYLTTMFYFIHK